MIGYFRWWDDRAVSEDVEQPFCKALTTPNWPDHRVARNGQSLSVHAATAAGYAPARLADGRTLLFTGTLFGRRALARELGVPPEDPAALYAAARDRWGERADHRLNGTYAAVIVSPERQEVEVLRSPLQAPPLYISEFAGGVVVASLPRAIHATGQVEKRLDRCRFADALVTNHKEQTRTWFEGIWSLPLGSRAILTPRGRNLQSYYDPNDVKPVTLGSDAEYEEAAREMLFRAVADCTEDAREPAISLSGGFDSMAIAYALVKLAPGRRVPGLTHVPSSRWSGKSAPGRFGDEWGEVQKLAAMYPEIEPHRIETDDIPLERHLSDFFDIGGVPPAVSFNMVWINELHRRARSMGVDVVLDGQPGNLTFSFAGDPAYGYLLSRGRVLAFAREVLSTLRQRHGGRQLLLQLATGRMSAQSYAATVQLARRLGVMNGYNSGAFSFIEPAWEHRMGSFERLGQFNPSRSIGKVRSNTGHRKMATQFPNTDKDAIAQTLQLMHGTTARSPLRSRPLTEFFMGLPPDQYYRYGETRRLSRRVLRGHVPDSVLDGKLRGQQSADFYLRLQEETPRFLEDLDRFDLDADLNEMLDLKEMREHLLRRSGAEMGTMRQLMKDDLLTRTINLARFYRQMSGRN